MYVCMNDNLVHDLRHVDRGVGHPITINNMIVNNGISVIDIIRTSSTNSISMISTTIVSILMNNNSIMDSSSILGLSSVFRLLSSGQYYVCCITD